RRQFVALGQLVFSLVDDLLEHIDLTRGHFFDLVDLLVDPRVFIGILDAFEIARRDALDGVAIENRVLGEQTLVGAFVVQIGLHDFAAQDVVQPLQTLVGQNSDFIRKVPLELANLRSLDCFGAFVFLLTFAGEDFHVDDHALDAGRAVQRSIAHIAGFFTEDGAQQLLFRRELSFTLGRYLAHQNVALLDTRADTNHARFVQIAQHGLADVGNIARDFFRSQLGVARLQFVLLDVYRGVVVVFDQFFGDQDCVFEVISAPRHESHEHVAAKRQLTVIGARTVRDDLAFGDSLAFDHNWLLVDAGVLVGALELHQLVDVATNFGGELSGMVLAFDARGDALRVPCVDHAVPPCQDDGTGIARRDSFHSRADDWSFGAEQWNRLPLHVCAHQRAVGVVVLKEGHKRCRYRNQLLRTDVDVVNFVAADQHKVAGFAGVNEIADDAALVVKFNVGLGDYVAVFFPSRKVEGEWFDLGWLFAAILNFGVDFLDFVLLDVVADFVVAVARVHHADVVDHAAVFHAAVWRFDETVVVDAGIAAQRRDQTDVRTFRRLNRADASVVRGVHVADFESCAFARQTARPKGRETPLVS